MPHLRMSHATLTNESCHTYEWSMTLMYTSYTQTHKHIQRKDIFQQKDIFKKEANIRRHFARVSHVYMYHTDDRVMSHTRMEHQKYIHPRQGEGVGGSYIIKGPLASQRIGHVTQLTGFCIPPQRLELQDVICVT